MSNSLIWSLQSSLQELISVHGLHGQHGIPPKKRKIRSIRDIRVQKGLMPDFAKAMNSLRTYPKINNVVARRVLFPTKQSPKSSVLPD